MKSYVFYDDTADYEAYDDVRAFLFDTYGEDNGWKTPDVNFPPRFLQSLL